MPTNNWGNPPQSAQDYQAARDAARFFSEVRVKCEGIKELAEVECFAVLVDAYVLLGECITLEQKRRAALKHRQLEIEGLLTLENRASANQGAFL